MEARAGIFRKRAKSECAGRGVYNDPGSLRLQRLALEAPDRVRLPADGARATGETRQAQDRPPRRERLGRTVVDQPPPPAGRQEGPERPSGGPAFRTRRRRPPTDDGAAAHDPLANASDQSSASFALETQLAAGMSDQGAEDQDRQEVAGKAAAGDDRPLGTGSAPSPMGTAGQTTWRTGSEDR